MIWFSALPGDLQQVRSPLIAPDWPATDPRLLRVGRVQEPVRTSAPDTCQPRLHDVDPDTPGSPPSLKAESAETNTSGEMVLMPPFGCWTAANHGLVEPAGRRRELWAKCPRSAGRMVEAAGVEPENR